MGNVVDSGTITSTTIGNPVKLYSFYWKENCPECDAEKAFLEQLKQKYPSFQYELYEVPSSPSATYSVSVLSNLKQGLPTIFFDDKIWIGYNDNIAAEIRSKIEYCLVNTCSLTPVIQTPTQEEIQKLAQPQITQEPTIIYK